ncbi:hypothetical protein OPV22_003800 [Ensete ventricosum]|uniref:Uncharacterized protein n=1 Tax=Ensete ventricosum TaxID=4639 RepID=A0AAV8S1Z0_ENSVE|nr:hypothetical protein OPV22_003800 [Ensete ventricosum]
MQTPSWSHGAAFFLFPLDKRSEEYLRPGVKYLERGSVQEQADGPTRSSHRHLELLESGISLVISVCKEIVFHFQHTRGGSAFGENSQVWGFEEGVPEESSSFPPPDLVPLLGAHSWKWLVVATIFSIFESSAHPSTDLGLSSEVP